MASNALPEQSIIRKIQNLLEMANRAAGNEAEAAVAMGKAQELLTKYNLDLRTVTDTHVAGGTVAAKRDKVVFSNSAMYRWQRELWKAVASANFCIHWVSEVRQMHPEWKKEVVAKRHVVLGAEANVLATQLMGDYLVQTIARLLPYPRTEQLSKSANSWKLGCAQRLVERINAKVESMKTEGVAAEGVVSTGLAVRDIFKAEADANYDARHGEGASVQRDMQAAKIAADWEADEVRRKELAELVEAARLSESPEARVKRERQEAAEAAKEARADAKWRAAYWRHCAREAAKLDHTALRAGRAAGNDISLDKQVGAGTRAKELK